MFHERFCADEKQPIPLLQASADLLKLTFKYWDPLIANFIVTASLNFLNSNALEARDVGTLKHSSTRDLATRVWGRLNTETLQSMPLDLFDGSDMEFVSASFHGALTRIQVRHGARSVTYVLRDENGRFFVDDVNWQKTGLPSSLKATMEILVPIQEFASAIAQGRDPQKQEAALERLQAISTADFNRMVWGQTRYVPNSGMSADTFLKAPLESIAITDQEVTVNLGDKQYGAKVTLRREFERYVVDDITLIAGVDDSQRLALKHSLRTQMARGEARAPQKVIQASYEEESRTSPPPRELEEDPFASDIRE